jgi:hypothetical protein
MIKVLVCGGREYANYEAVYRTLESFKACHVGHGGARGADSLAGQAAQRLGYEVSVFPAQWDKFGPAAGCIRNQDMLRDFCPDMVIAFKGGKGTEHMKRTALAKNVPVLEVLE